MIYRIRDNHITRSITPSMLLRHLYLLRSTNCSYSSRAPEFTIGFLVGSVLLIFLVSLRCPIMCLYVLSYVLWGPLLFPRIKIIFGSFLPLCLIYVFCVCLRLCCQFLWIVYLWAPLRYSLTFIYKLVYNLHSLFAEIILITKTLYKQK